MQNAVSTISQFDLMIMEADGESGPLLETSLAILDLDFKYRKWEPPANVQLAQQSSLQMRAPTLDELVD